MSLASFRTFLIAFCVSLPLVGGAGIAQGQRRDETRGTSPLQMTRVEIQKKLGTLARFAEGTGDIHGLIERLADANEREDRGSVFYIGSLIVDRLWNGLVGVIKKWAADNAAAEHLDHQIYEAVAELNRFAEKLESISVGPFVFDPKKEEAMVAQTRDRLLLTKVAMRGLMRNNWRDELATLGVDFSLRTLFGEVVKLRADVTRLEREVKTLKGLGARMNESSAGTPCECDEEPTVIFDERNTNGHRIIWRSSERFR